MEVGPYTIERQLGEGGMGAVYLASRTDHQFEKKVALKLILTGANSKTLMESFRRERQILAGMEHPNITRLLDGGVNSDGRPYFVMDYVDGMRIDEVCKDQPVATRIEIFRKVCAAVTYAHQNLVIHRDLKPSNILVTADNEPKLLDFGIATVLSTQAQAVTVTAGAAFTPLYASPEMIKSERITVGTDVYSLGVILYELLAGRSPYTLQSSNPMSLYDQILNVEPPRPSTLPAELDAITRKALAKSPEERYRTVEQLSDDLRRFLAGMPVKAVPPGVLYKTRKFVLRHRVAVALSTLTTLVLLTTLLTMVWQARIADRQFQETRKLAKFLLFDLYSGVQQLPGGTPVQAEMANRSLAYLDTLSASKPTHLEMKNELAEGYLRIGNVLGNPFESNLGKREEAMKSYAKALAIVESLQDARARLTRVRLMLITGGIRTFNAKTQDEGIALVRKALTDLETYSAAAPADLDLRYELGAASQSLARHLMQSEGWITDANAAEAKRFVLNGRAHLEAVLAARSNDPMVLRRLAINHQIEALSTASGNPQEALKAYAKSLAYLDRTPPPGNGTVIFRMLRAAILVSQSWEAGQAGEHAEALRIGTLATETWMNISASDPLNAGALYSLAGAHRTLAIVHGYTARHTGSLGYWRKVEEACDRLLTMEPGAETYVLMRAEAQIRQGDMLVLAGRANEAPAIAAKGLNTLIQIADAPEAQSWQKEDAASWLLNTEVVSLRQPKKALAYLKGLEMKASTSYETLAKALYLTGDVARAVEAIDKAMQQVDPTSRNWKTMSEARASYLSRSK